MDGSYRNSRDNFPAVAKFNDPPRARRTGGRSARVRTSVLEATIEVLFETGFDTLSIREVAERARVHESSIYRRWGTKSNLASEALLSRARLAIPTPDTGSLREDLLVLLRAVAGFLVTPLGENMVRMALRNDLPNSDAARDNYWNDRFTRASAILDRAENRGELRHGVDRFLTIETLVGPLYLRMLLTREPLTDSVLEMIVDLVVTGIVVNGA
jgi:AcrR family transcriptional regulator